MMQQEIIESTLVYLNSEDETEELFNQQAMMLFDYQFRNNKPYQNFCRQKGKTLRTVKNWKDIPAVPINAFKEVPLSCGNPAEAEAVFMTSGTTLGIKGNHFHPKLSVYDESMTLNFKKRFMNGVEKIRMGILFPTEEEMPNSSLAHYLALASKKFGTEDSLYHINENGLQVGQLISEMENAEKTQEPFALVGASFSFVHLMEELDRIGKTFSLPKGSRILDTGGFKNKSKELELEDFYHQLSATFGVDRDHCVNMYGMTELSTQFYDSGNLQVPSIKSGPHWIRTRVINPLSGEELTPGERGVLVHCDLANFNSTTTILTEDMGVEVENGFLLLGRVKGTEAKGCSVAADEFIRAARGHSL